jgi:hypothetical protein
MHRISSQMTFFYKRVTPIIWFGFIALSLATPLVRFLFRLPASIEPLPFLLAPAFMAIVGYFIMRKLLFDLVDELLDGGDALIIRNRGVEERLPLAYIITVNYAPLTSPPRVTLSLRYSGPFGDKVAFCAPVRFSPLAIFSPNPASEDLINRIDAAGRRSAH